MKVELFWIELLQISNTKSICMFQGFLLMNMTCPQVNWLKSYESSKFGELKKRCDLVNKMDIFLTRRTLTACNFWASWPTEELYTSKKKVLKHTNWLNTWNREQICPKNQQINFDEKGLMLILGGVAVFWERPRPST